MTVYPDTTVDKDIASSSITALKFFSRWDQKSRMLEETFSELANYFGDKAKFIESEINANQLLAKKFSIQKVPTICLFCKEKMICRIEDIPPKRILREEIEKYIRRSEFL